MYIVKNTRVCWTVLSWSRTELLPQVDGIQTDRGAACAALAGYVTLTARNGDSMMHGVLPSVIPHHGAALNSCFPGSDGNWWVKQLCYAALNRKSNIIWTGKRAFFEQEKWMSFEWENQHLLNRKTSILWTGKQVSFGTGKKSEQENVLWAGKQTFFEQENKHPRHSLNSQAAGCVLVMNLRVLRPNTQNIYLFFMCCVLMHG